VSQQQLLLKKAAADHHLYVPTLPYVLGSCMLLLSWTVGCTQKV
jgi:hypothetical protein